MIDLSKFKDLGSRVVKPVIKPYHPAHLPILRQLPRIELKPNNNNVHVAHTAVMPDNWSSKPKNILLSNGIALK